MLNADLVQKNATYRVDQSYKWNYENGPIFSGEVSARKLSKTPCKFLGYDLNSCVGVAAGPLLNSKFVDLYARLGFDVLTYKTVRTIQRDAHIAPNCVYVDSKAQIRPEQAGKSIVEANDIPEKIEDITITNSFGMPSAATSDWMTDVARARAGLGAGQLLIVSVVGTPDLPVDFIDDFVSCAKLAKEAGAMAIEVNYSCPNVCTGEGNIFTDADLSSRISKRIKEEIGDLPLIIKVGYFEDEEQLEAVVKANMPYIDCIAGINTIPMKVYKQSGEQALPGEGRLQSGLCGAAIHDLAEDFLRKLVRVKNKLNGRFEICSVGGITHPDQIAERFKLGADAVQTATGAMWDPYLAEKYHNLTA